ncbi:hypothetical protein JHK82_050417 [Glycine max]|nr:hypothetical protein JHK86_050260 [Glycine max]KAG4924569.1 hypothetical protein JHK87_050109 [Glycine soja]KAG4936134.1 hypothetical protein JHK85_051053 [Glycine max]KAG5091639.1 hypothetical protein JHK82_050417 [Glycine max]KAG5094734.1 hypothetical protein JHK84_050322 [Glycine max]
MVSSNNIVEQLREEIPVKQQSLTLSGDIKTGLILVDVVNGFCSIGAGNLAPKEPDERISQMVKESVRLSKAFSLRESCQFLLSLIPITPTNPNPLIHLTVL